MDFEVQLSFHNINSPELGEYGVDHVKVVEGLGCKAMRVFDPEKIQEAIQQARKIDDRAVGAGGGRGDHRARDRHRDGPEIDKITEFEETVDVEEEEGFLDELAA